MGSVPSGDAVVGTERNARTILVRTAADRHSNRGIVLTGDRDRRGLRAAQPVVVRDGVAECVGRGLACSKMLELTVGVVGERAVAVVGDSTQRSARVHRE